MPNTNELLRLNREWSRSVTAKNPDFFTELAKQQKPDYLWVGCSDSRVPANELLGLAPGEVFVHRNVSNIVSATDLNFLAVLEFAVKALRVHHVIICGHYGCGGVTAVLDNARMGGIDYWLQPIRNLYYEHQEALDAIPDKAERIDRLSELNVLQQAHNVSHSTIVQDTWDAGQQLTVHSWIYGLKDGLLTDLQQTINSAADRDASHEAAVRRLLEK